VKGLDFSPSLSVRSWKSSPVHDHFLGVLRLHFDVGNDEISAQIVADHLLDIGGEIGDRDRQNEVLVLALEVTVVFFLSAACSSSAAVKINMRRLAAIANLLSDYNEASTLSAGANTHPWKIRNAHAL
jgi:hypothetical protein